MRKYLNNSNVPLSLAVFLATDNYDHESDTISATTLIKPLRQIILAARVPQEQGLVDVSGMVSSRMGSAIHDGIERAWMLRHVEAMTALGYPKKVIAQVRVNPKPEELGPGIIPVYLEQRAYREIEGRKVSGKFDFVGDGRVEDFKSTSVYTYINNTNDEKYKLQGGIYRWLNPKIITQDTMAIQFIFTDWSQAQAKSSQNYPASRTLEHVLRLPSMEFIEEFIRNKIRNLDKFWHAPENEIPLCTEEDLWRSAPQYKYYKNPAKTQRSTKNFDNKQDAYMQLATDGNVGKVVEVPGQVKACRYCPGFYACTQKDKYLESGELQL